MLHKGFSTMLIAATLGVGLVITHPATTHAATNQTTPVVQPTTESTTATATKATKTKAKVKTLKTKVKLTSLQATATNTGNLKANIVQSAATHLGEPYVYGGTQPGAFDCSGFTQYLYQQVLGKTIPRVAQAQYNLGTKVATNKLKTGDLVFFGSDASNITHVGLYVGNGQMIDAQNRGVIKESIYASWWNLVGAARY